MVSDFTYGIYKAAGQKAHAALMPTLLKRAGGKTDLFR